MTIQDQIDQLKKELSTFIGNTNKKIAELEVERIKVTNHSKPTRYYPNGAYMDEPEEGETVYYISSIGGVIFKEFWGTLPEDNNLLDSANIFPTKEAAEKELNRQKLTAKMYRDMRDESINGDWVATKEINPDSDYVFYPHFTFQNKSGLGCGSDAFKAFPHDFYYKNKTFIEDLKALGWTEEELKIVWFRV